MAARACAGCGEVFETLSLRQARCKPGCGRSRSGRDDSNAARTAKRLAHDLEFIAVDGEGVTDEHGQHHYVLLSVGDQSLSHPDGRPLHLLEIFDFLWQQFLAHPNAVFTGYFLAYDYAQWLKTLPRDRAFFLLTREGLAKRQRTIKARGNPIPFPVRYDAWEFDMHADKRFKLRPRPIAGQKPGPWMYICDSGPFFQAPFLTAIDPRKWPTPIVSDQDFAVIAEGKAARGTAVLGPDMIRYNVAENRAMAKMMAALNRGLVDMGVRLDRRQWYGPGQAAAAWMDAIEAPTGEAVRDATPDQARAMAQESYLGGWFEIMAHGPIRGASYEYDLNGAYPWIISRLPCLLHGKWSSGEGEPKPLRKGSYRLIRAAVRGSADRIGAMPHRTPGGAVLRPRRTSGVYWQHEVDAARAAGLIDSVEVSEWMDYRPCACEPPLAPLAGLYKWRLAAGKESPLGKALKVVYNSVYGKLAQSVGSPKFANSLYASLITASCRAEMCLAIASHPRKSAAVLMVATDGLTFDSEHPALDISPDTLGRWSAAVREDLTLFMPGMYWDRRTREALAQGDTPRFRSRGIPAKSLAGYIGEIDQAFDAMTMESGWPQVDIETMSYVTARQAFVSHGWHQCGMLITDSHKIMDSDPRTKRDPRTFYEVDGVIRTLPYEQSPDGTLFSTPYSLTFGDEIKLANLKDPVLPEGTITDLLRDIMFNVDVDTIDISTFDIDDFSM